MRKKPSDMRKEEIIGRARALFQAAVMVAAFVVFGKASEGIIRGGSLHAATEQTGFQTDSVLSAEAPEHEVHAVVAQPSSSRKTFTKSDSIRIMARAFAMVESTENPKAYNQSSGATGYLQLKPIMVREANRILNMTRKTVGVWYYTYDDRWDREKSVEMFSVVMEHKNRKLSVREACRIWNYKHTELYYTTVKRNFERLLAEAVM